MNLGQFEIGCSHLHLVDGMLELKLDLLHVVFEFDLFIIRRLVQFLLEEFATNVHLLLKF